MNHYKEDEKDIQILFDEIKKRNTQISVQHLNFIKFIFYQIDQYYTNNVQFMEKELLQNEVYLLRRGIKQDPFNNEYYIKLIAIMKQIFFLINGYIPRNIQIIAILFFLYKDRHSGLIEEILTGEGKTTIISFLAILKVFQGKKVDILTSSIVLAERDAKEMKPFYNFFGVSVDYCKDNKGEYSLNNEYV